MALIKRRVVAPANLDKQSTGSHLSRVAKLTDDGAGGGGGTCGTKDWDSIYKYKQKDGKRIIDGSFGIRWVGRMSIAKALSLSCSPWLVCIEYVLRAIGCKM